MVIVCDDEDRENEGDLTMAAQFASAERINFMAKDGRGLVCLTLTPQRCAELNLPPMTVKNEARLQTAFTVSVEAREGVTTGISAADRAHTIQVAIDPRAAPATWCSRARVPAHGAPGRRARARRPDRGRRRPRAPRRPVPGRRHLRDHERRRHHGARARTWSRTAQKHGLKIITVADLIKYRRRNEKLIRRGADRLHADQVRRLQGRRLRVGHRRRASRGAGQGRGGRAARTCWCGSTPSASPATSSARCAATAASSSPRRCGASRRRARGRALHAPGGPRHRPAQQAQGLRPAGAGWTRWRPT